MMPEGRAISGGSVPHPPFIRRLVFPSPHISVHGEDGVYAVESGVWKIGSTGSVKGRSAREHGARNPNVRVRVIKRMGVPTRTARGPSAHDHKESARVKLGKGDVRMSPVSEMHACNRNGAGWHAPGSGTVEGHASRTGVRMLGVRVRDLRAPRMGVPGHSARGHGSRNRKPSGHGACRRGMSGCGGPSRDMRTNGGHRPGIRGHRNVTVPVGEPLSIAGIPPSGDLREMPAGIMVPSSVRRIGGAGMRLAARKMPGGDRVPDTGGTLSAGRSPCQTCLIRVSSPYLSSSCSCLH